MTVDDLIYIAVAVVWLTFTLASPFLFHIFSSARMRQAPPRRGTISLAFVGVVLLLYLSATLLAVGIAGSAGIPTAPPEATTGPASTAAGSVPTTAGAGTRVDTIQIKLNAQLVQILPEVVAVGLFLLLVPRLFAEGFKGFGLAWGKLPLGIPLGLLTFACLYPGLVGTNWLSEAIAKQYGHNIAPHPIIQVLEEYHTTPTQKLWFFLAAGVMAPFCEEIFFRGIIQSSLIQQGWGFIVARERLDLNSRPSVLQRWLAIVITAGAFAWVHPMDVRLVIFTLALGLGYIYERTGNLWAAITVHATFNTASLLPVLLGTAHP